MNLEQRTINEVKQDDFKKALFDETQALEPERVQIPEIGDVLVCGNLFDLADRLDDIQGDNILNAQGDCGVVSVVNIARLCGISCDENDAIVKAVQLRLCNYSTALDSADNGGTNVYQRKALLAEYGISSTVFMGDELAPEQIARLVETGHAVNLGVNAGYAWGNADYINDGSSNHSIIVTGSARNPETHELVGLFVCDSGYPGKSNAVFLPLGVLEDAYTNAPGSSALVTDRPVSV
ncbi:MAG: hypothetical protein IJ899_10365 [Blautia sp.]|nr:hypothetical protein [Blautia sp.]